MKRSAVIGCIRGHCAASLAALAVFSIGAFAYGDNDDSVVVVSEGQTHATIVIEQDLSSSLREAVQLLSECVAKSTGAALPIETSPPTSGTIQIHIGQTEYVKSLDLIPDGFDIDGFIIAFPDDTHVVVVGGSAIGSEFGVYDFLERYVGVRWLIPGPVGEHVPVAAELILPRQEVISAPTYISRQISTRGGSDLNDPIGIWLRRQRQNWRVQHHHNLLNLFPPDIYGESHPEFFPMVQGERYIPELGSQDWQPVLDADGIVEEAIARINEYFDEHPQATSYSLGMNDTNDFRRAAEQINSVGHGDYSDYYFEFANQVAEGVLQEHPDKWFGCLAYMGINDPPHMVSVHPRIIPHITIDRMSWASETHAERDKERTKRWLERAPVLGWYDYIYGDELYLVPRIYMHVMAEYLRYGAEHGVKAYYAEHYATPTWLEGPKLYVTMKLLWDSTLDVDELLDEWYTLMVGADAAPALRSYYEFWEDYWTRRVLGTRWFEEGADSVYFTFDGRDYLVALTLDDMQQCDRLIEQVVALAATPEQQARANFISEGYSQYRELVADYIRLANMSLPEDAPHQAVFQDEFEATGAHAEMPTGWSYWQNDNGTAQFRWDTTHGLDGGGSLAVDAEGAVGTLTFTRVESVEGNGDLYLLRCQLRTEGLNPEACPGVEVRWRANNGDWLPRKTTVNRYLSADEIASDGWQTVELYFRTPMIINHVSLQAMPSVIKATQGTIWFDNVELLKIDEGDTVQREDQN